MRPIALIILSLLTMSTISVFAHEVNTDDVDVIVLEDEDSISIKLTALKIETQLAFLMQGLNISVLQEDTLTLSFPSALVVRDRVKRHPNEVKAELSSTKGRRIGNDSINQVIRPDVQPLVAALNDTTANLKHQNTNIDIRTFKIDVDVEKELMTFSIHFSKKYILDNSDELCLSISSIPNDNNRKEFYGRRLSSEKQKNPNGLGEGIRKEDIEKRSFHKDVIVKKNRRVIEF